MIEVLLLIASTPAAAMVAVQNCEETDVVTSQSQDSDPPEPVDHRTPPAVAIREEEVRMREPKFKSGKGELRRRSFAPQHPGLRREVTPRAAHSKRPRTKVRFS